MNEMMEFMEELKELVHKGEQIAHKMQGGNFGQRSGYGHYGMRNNQSGYSGGNYGQRWGGGQMQGGYPPMQGGYPGDINPMMFM